MKNVQKGFTLIELMIVVAIIAILAAIALPAYRDYTVRAKVTEAVTAIGACKTSVTEYHMTKNSFPADAAEAGCNNGGSQYVASMSVGSTGAISATTKATGSKPGDCVLTLTPAVSADTGEISAWNGSSTGCTANYVPSSYRGS